MKFHNCLCLSMLICCFSFTDPIPNKTKKATGKITFEILDAETMELVPGKVVVLKGIEPHNHLVETSGNLACRDHVIYSGDGQGTFEIKAGSYAFWFGRGMEYSIYKHDLRVTIGGDHHIQAIIKKELDTRGFVGGDMHLHTYTYSGHGDATVEERLISCAAEGLEWAVSTDHNYVLDYGPWMDSLGLKEFMATSVGNEVSTNIGHFNTYPLISGSEPINHKEKDGYELFKNIRAKAPESVVIQINHPRWVDSDYFNVKGLDPFFGTTKHPEFSWDFDAFEVLNENGQIGWRQAPDNKFSIKEDWFNLLNHGHKIAGLGNSDSHSVTEAIAGIPRNYIASSTDFPIRIEEEEIAANIKAQKVSVAQGIFVNMTANRKFGIGSTVKKGDKSVLLKLSVQAPSWVSCNKVELIRNGVVIQTFNLPATENALRMERTVEVDPSKDSWYMLIAYGDKSMSPFMQIKKVDIMPLGFTNPIWVDANNDDKITSLYDYCEKRFETLADDEDRILRKMDKEPEIVPYIFQLLFETNHENAISITEQYLEKASTRHRLMLYRELAKMKNEAGLAILKNQLDGNLNPLEEVTANWYVNFPLNQSRFDNFKGRRDTLLDDQLSYLETEFAYLHAGSKKQKVMLASQVEDDFEVDWLKVTVPNDGILEVDKKLPSQGKTHFLIKQELWARKDGTIRMYVRSNASLETIVNDAPQYLFVTKEKIDIELRMIPIKLKKGKNEIIFRTPVRPDLRVALLPINLEKLVNPKLSEIEMAEHLAREVKVEYQTDYSDRYHGFDVALTDGWRGTEDHYDGFWQAWEGKDVEFVLDLGEKESISRVTLGLLLNQDSWIFYPEKLEVLISENGEDFESVSAKEFVATKEVDGVQLRDFQLNFDETTARYVKVKAKNINYLPEWHKSSGKKGTWIFIDEIMVK